MPLRGNLDRHGHPRVPITVAGPNGNAVLQVIVDTGFSGALAVPAQTARALGLLLTDTRPTRLADGSLRVVRVYLADVHWLGTPIVAEAWATGGTESLVGAGLLQGHTLEVDYGPPKSVEIR